MTKATTSRILCFVVSALLVIGIVAASACDADAKASKKGRKFLKGIWVSQGSSQSYKYIFGKKYVKVYTLWNKDYTKVKSPDKKGKYIGKSKIVSTKKKGKRWIIKVGKKGSYIYYKSNGKNYLENWWKEGGEWHYSGTDSLWRYK